MIVVQLRVKKDFYKLNKSIDHYVVVSVDIAAGVSVFRAVLRAVHLRSDKKKHMLIPGVYGAKGQLGEQMSVKP